MTTALAITGFVAFAGLVAMVMWLAYWLGKPDRTKKRK